MNAALLLRPTSYLFMLLLMLFFEWFAPFAKSEQKKSHRFAFHFCMSIANTFLLYLILAWPIHTITEFTKSHKLCFTAFLGLSGLSEIVATVIAFDCWDYWMHLANHKISFLWRFHRAHHSDMEVDVTTALRFHIGELVISGVVKCAMIVVWGPSLWGLVIFDSLLTGASEFHHSNVNIPFRIQDLVEAVVVTPRMHRCHHALHRNCFNTNFSTILSIWDRFFRSYHWAAFSQELIPIGLFRPRGASTMQLKPFLLTPIKES